MPNWTGGRLSSNFAYHSPDFLNRSATIDFRYKGLPGFAFVCSGKSEAEVTDDKRLRSRYCRPTVESK